MKCAPLRSPNGEPHLILIVEDEFLISMELAAVLEDSGFRVLGPAASTRAALALLNEQCPHAAVLDMNLDGEMVTPVAHVLRKMDVPFVIASAYSRAGWPDDKALDGVPTLRKPTPASDLVETLHALVDVGDQA